MNEQAAVMGPGFDQAYGIPSGFTLSVKEKAC